MTVLPQGRSADLWRRFISRRDTPSKAAVLTAFPVQSAANRVHDAAFGK